MSGLMNKVLMMYNINEKHEYFICLLKELLKENTNIFLYKEYRFLFPVFLNILRLKNCRIVHYHFINSIAGFKTKYKIKLLLSSIKFLVDVYLIKYLLHTKIIWTVNNMYSHELFFPRLEKFIRRHFAKKADILIAHCNEAKKKVQKEFIIPPNKIFMIPHGNYLTAYNNEISKERAREILSLSKNQLVFLHFGNIRPYKGIDRIIEDFSHLKNDGNIKLLIVGKSINKEIEDLLITKAKGNTNIKFKFERIPNNDVQIYMNASDIIVASYHKILTSGTVILAMSFGIPFIAPRLGCIPEISNENDAFLYNPKEKNGLLNSLQKAIDNKEKLNVIGQNNLNSIRKFDWNKIAKKTKKVYERFFE